MFYCVLKGFGIKSSESKLRLYNSLHWHEILRLTLAKNRGVFLSDMLRIFNKIAHIFISGIWVICMDHRKLSHKGGFYYCASRVVAK